MKQHINPNRPRRSNRWARLKQQLNRARTDRDTLERKFEIEKNAKNRAYAFIISNGLYNEFAKFHKETAVADPMNICREALKQRQHNE